MIIEFLQLKVKISVKNYCDNIGAIFMRNNAKQSIWTKHINVRYHFIGEYVVDGMVEIVLIPSEDNNLDILPRMYPK